MITITMQEQVEKMTEGDLVNSIAMLSATISRRQREGKPVFEQIMEREQQRKELFSRTTVISL